MHFTKNKTHISCNNLLFSVDWNWLTWTKTLFLWTEVFLNKRFSEILFLLQKCISIRTKSTFYYEEIDFNQFLFIGFRSKKTFPRDKQMNVLNRHFSIENIICSCRRIKIFASIMIFSIFYSFMKEVPII